MALPALAGLTTRFRPLAEQLLLTLLEERLLFLIVETGPRTLAQHQKNLDTGKSWTQITKHLDARDRGWSFSGSDAIDIAPYEVYQAHGDDKVLWNADDPIWQRAGILGENLGLRWLGRTTQDLGHFELHGPAFNPGGAPNILLATLRLPKGVPRTYTV